MLCDRCVCMYACCGNLNASAPLVFDDDPALPRSGDRDFVERGERSDDRWSSVTTIRSASLSSYTSMYTKRIARKATSHTKKKKILKNKKTNKIMMML